MNYDDLFNKYGGGEDKQEDKLQDPGNKEKDLEDKVKKLEALLQAQQDQIKELVDQVSSLAAPKIIVRSLTESRAQALRDHFETMKPRNSSGAIFLSASEIQHFLIYEISRDLRLKKVKSPWKSTSNVIDKLLEMYPHSFKLEKNRLGKGRKILIFQPFD